MKHTVDVVINAPLALVWRVFDDPDNMPKWQPTLKSFEHKSGTPGQPGAVSELTYDENGREFVMTETITERREQDFLAGVYTSSVGTTLIVNHFVAIDDNSTRWSMWCNFQFKGLMKVMSLFMAGSIRKRTNCDLERFKLLAESIAAEA